jgi:hypothetical protein
MRPCSAWAIDGPEKAAHGEVDLGGSDSVRYMLASSSTPERSMSSKSSDCEAEGICIGLLLLLLLLLRAAARAAAPGRDGACGTGRGIERGVGGTPPRCCCFSGRTDRGVLIGMGLLVEGDDDVEAWALAA